MWPKEKNCTFKNETLALLHLQVSVWSQLFAVNGFIMSMLGLMWRSILPLKMKSLEEWLFTWAFSAASALGGLAALVIDFTSVSDLLKLTV